uniref:DNA-binding protein n=1 Tax=Polaromonas sp. TaxID=1869339 RepID=UPI001597D00C|nr:DNA-binding protein [Polaromonas sp.]QJS06521.1 putative plasmid replication region [Polaromonas sp.]
MRSISVTNDDHSQAPPTEDTSFATLDAVRAVVAADPSILSSGAKVRVQLGNRGGLSTIQKHLKVLREERDRLAVAQATPATSAPAAPTPPAELASALWAMAWGTAQQSLLARMTTLTVERDTTRESLTAERQDNQELRDELERAELTASKATVAAGIDRIALTEAKALSETLNLSLEKSKAECQAALEAQAAAHAMADREAVIKVETLQATVDRAGQRYGELAAQLAEANRRIEETSRRNDELVAKLAELAGLASQPKN